MVDLDAAFGEEILEVSVRQPEPEVPADRQHDHFGRVPVPGEGGRKQTVLVGRRHRRSLSVNRPGAQCNRPLSIPLSQYSTSFEMLPSGRVLS